ncbi:hypothetical protein [Enterovibrio nigricans]|uniref:Uncharacterized protein n=1 Tax=Enterovibrio nigricans DSM 22720 TaxID=1121868 RepID=A0A1T4V4M0_9GAMM|nr:hypothetical protein [Enterovibrio nigricans]PKF50483.1 hypothetical protein AT251_11205 [Enterovibrio nigricans]SKA59846.1 hypothetical protein SAMN02745132_03181 [Enterovibrio nigricans DSM 22720]
MQNNLQSQVISGLYQLTDEWQLHLPAEFNVSMEDEDLVIWHEGFTIWCSIWSIDPEESPEEALEWIIEEQAEEAFDVDKSEKHGLVNYRYRLFEETNDYRVASVYNFTFSHTSYVQLGIYFNDEAALSTANAVCNSLKFKSSMLLH